MTTSETGTSASFDVSLLGPPTAPVVVYCAGGYRSSIAASALTAAGFDDVSDVLGGYEGWRARQR